MGKKTKPPAKKRAAEGACPDCGDTGYLVAEEGARPCHCLARRQMDRRLRRAHIPPRFLAKTIDGFTAKTKPLREIHAAVTSYVEGFGPRLLGAHETSKSNGLLFIGIPGSGKTHLAVGILRTIIERGYSGLFCNVVNFLDELRNSFDPQSPLTGSEIMESVVSADLLVFDDLGAEAPTGWVRDRLYQIINRRYEFSRPTIVTTNSESLDDLERQIGERITSRLCEMCHEVRFPAEDWRRAHMRD